MKFVCFLAVVSCAVALPADVLLDNHGELDFSKLKPKNLYLEPVNPVKPEDELPGSRIIGGSEVSTNSVPYQAALIINGASLCGGSLISTNRVLTAAHCTVSASFVNVILGAHNINQNEANQVRITSTSIVNHASYNVGSFAANDVAIVLLPSNAALSSVVQTISLASGSNSYEGSSAYLAGWGRTSDASGASSPILMGINLSVISNSACSSVYGSAIVDSSLCTSGSGTIGACNGDSGGPLVVSGVQVGVVSFGSERCQAGNPSVFARVTSFRSWIQQNSGV